MDMAYMSHNVPMVKIDKNVHSETSLTLLLLTLFAAWNNGLNSKSVEMIKIISSGVKVIMV